jgi:hypothetical protein
MGRKTAKTKLANFYMKRKFMAVVIRHPRTNKEKHTQRIEERYTSTDGKLRVERTRQASEITFCTDLAYLLAALSPKPDL